MPQLQGRGGRREVRDAHLDGISGPDVVNNAKLRNTQPPSTLKHLGLLASNRTPAIPLTQCFVAPLNLVWYKAVVLTDPLYLLLSTSQFPRKFHYNHGGQHLLRARSRRNTHLTG